MISTSVSRTFPRALRQTRCSQKFRQITTTSTAVEHHEPDGYNPDVAIPVPSSTLPERKSKIRDAQPFSEFLTDNFHRQHDYLRISVTEKCNLRCLYCMPEEGIDLSPSKTQLTTPEIYYLSALFVNQGVNKIRLTGGEPTVRKDIVPLMQKIGSLRQNGLKELALTTNAISLHRKLDAMVEAGLTGVNISLDTLDPFEFQLLTRRQGFEAVMKSINRVQEMNKVGAGIKLKINAVVMRGLNGHQVLPFVEMTRDRDIEVRFIEYMPFGGNKWSENKMLPYAEMLDMIREQHPTLTRMRDAKNDTSKTWHIPGFKGRIGFITSMTHNFCGTCNRLRITSDGNLKVCLHGNAEVSLRDLLRENNAGEPMDEEAFEAVRQIEMGRRGDRSLAFDGEEGWTTQESRLLDVIGAAVKRKKEKHAGIGELEKMTNRPMILIGEQCPLRISGPVPNLLQRQTSTVANTLRPFPSIPVHLFSPSSVSLPHQVRCYSSVSSSPPGEQREPERPTSEGFGFQSLTALFHHPLGGRYSRTRTANRDNEQAMSEQSKSVGMTQTSESADPSENSMIEKNSNNFFGSSWGGGSQTVPNAGNDTKSGSMREVEVGEERGQLHSTTHPQMSDVAVSRQTQGRARIRRYISLESGINKLKPSGRYSSRRARVPNPFAPSLHESQRQASSSKLSPHSSWGLQAGDMDTIDSFSDPSAAALGSHSKPTKRRVHKTTLPASASTTPSLTHLTPSGSARMVDVAAKPASLRVAIAHALVRFSNPTSHQLISTSTNAKGDALSVARIAGIMAAKRTADLIPLCHPLPLTKVDMIVTSHAPGTMSPDAQQLWRSEDNSHGVVSLTARVECLGPTGVEMEALTAVSVAALTVYDMCKAVDQGIVVEGTKLLYKSGGRRGVYISPQVVGTEWLVTNGLAEK